MKKLIALVLFVAMMAMMVPTASAAIAGTLSEKPLDGDVANYKFPDTGDKNTVVIGTDYWYLSPNPESVKDEPSTTKVVENLKNGFYIGANGNWDGGVVTVKRDSDHQITVTVKGDFYEIEPQSVNGSTWTPAIRIPFAMYDKNGDLLTVDKYLATAGSNGLVAKSYGNKETAAWLYMPLKAGGVTDSILVSPEDDTQQVLIKVVYEDTFGKVDEKTYWTNVTFEVMELLGNQTGNFQAVMQKAQNGTGDAYDVGKALTAKNYNLDAKANGTGSFGQLAQGQTDTRNAADERNAYGADVDWAASYEGGASAVNTLTLNIAALNPASRKAILDKATSVEATTTTEPGIWSSVSGSSAGYEVTRDYYKFNKINSDMIVRLRAYQPDGSLYPAGTIVQLLNVSYSNNNKPKEDYYWSTLIGASNRMVGSDGSPQYYLDNRSSFVLSIPGIVAFAASAAGMNPQVKDVPSYFGSSAVLNMFDVLENYSKIFQNNYNNGNGLTAEQYKQLTDFTQGSNNFTWAYKWYIGRLGLQFVYGVTVHQAALDVYFQNVDKTTSGVAVNGSAYQMNVGDTRAIPYTYTDPTAMTKPSVSWTSVDPSIVKVSGDTATAVKAGTTYLFATVDGKTLIITVTVVDPSTVPADVTAQVVGTSTAAYTKYVVTASKLNVRSGMGTGTSKVGSYARNAVVAGKATTSSEWIEVVDGNTGAHIGYCSAKYLAEIE